MLRRTKEAPSKKNQNQSLWSPKFTTKGKKIDSMKQ